MPRINKKRSIAQKKAWRRRKRIAKMQHGKSLVVNTKEVTPSQPQFETSFVKPVEDDIQYTSSTSQRANAQLEGIELTREERNITIEQTIFLLGDSIDALGKELVIFKDKANQISKEVNTTVSRLISINNELNKGF